MEAFSQSIMEAVVEVADIRMEYIGAWTWRTQMMRWRSTLWTSLRLLTT